MKSRGMIAMEPLLQPAQPRDADCGSTEQQQSTSAGVRVDSLESSAVSTATDKGGTWQFSSDFILITVDIPMAVFCMYRPLTCRLAESLWGCCRGASHME